jgi:hypothetical protein
MTAARSAVLTIATRATGSLATRSQQQASNFSNKQQMLATPDSLRVDHDSGRHQDKDTK